MKVVILYHPRSDHAQTVESFAHDFSRQVGRRLELISLESRDGSATASLYDITRYPAILALSDAGEMLRAWQGPVMPLINELSYYTQQ
jgi:hypothetical protein